jgi:putative phosphoesterase
MPARPVEHAATIELAEECARIAVVADTHSRPHPEAARHLAAMAPAAILHAGDIGDPAVLEGLAEIAPLHAVRGNIDARGLPDHLVLDVKRAGRAPLRMLLTHIAVDGVRIRGDVARLARARGASLIVCGHSHVPFIVGDRELTLFNPGSIGPRRFHLPIVFGRIDLAGDEVELAHVDCETGGAWTPPRG